MRFVLAISIGPVAHFIAAGRRSRDLWYGSTWLSRTIIAVADDLRKQNGVALLAPTDKRISELLAAPSKQNGGRVSNKILALVTVEQSESQKRLSELATQCRTKAREFLIARLEEISEIPLLMKNDAILHRGALQAQIKAIRQGDFIEFAAAWAPAPDGDPFFGNAVARACQLRDATPKLFVHPSFSKAGVARSDLDEGRDSVLFPEKRDDDVEIRRARAKLGLIESEELDAIGLLRRLSPRMANAQLSALPFPPVTRVAVDAWLEGCANSPEAKPAFERLQFTMAEALGDRQKPNENFLIWCTSSAEPKHVTNCFPYEASVLLENGCEALAKFVNRTLDGNHPSGAIEETLRNVNRHVRSLYKIAGLPIPYYAFIEMDGDGIGEYLKESESTKVYQDRVGELDAFAAAAVDIVETYGSAMYVAADELAAYVPLDKALDVVKKLADCFATEVRGKTISAGIVFAHARDDLRGVRKAAHDALEDAKAERKKDKCLDNGYVCLRERPRSGLDRETIGPLNAVHEEMSRLVKAIAEGRISLRTEQHLRDHKERFEIKDAPATPEIPPGVCLAKDAVRKQFERSGDTSGVDPLENRVKALKTWEHVEQLANELRIASRIADVQAQREGRHE